MLATFIAEPAHIEHSFVTERWEDILLLLLPSEVKLSPFNLKTPKCPLWAMTQKTKRKIKNKEHRPDKAGLEDSRKQRQFLEECL